MNHLDQVLENLATIFFLIIGIFGTAYAYGLVGDRLAGGFRWRPEFRQTLQWLGPVLVLLCLVSLVFLVKQ